MKLWLGIVCAAAVMTGAAAAQDAKGGGKTIARFDTSMGAFAVELFDKDAPKTVANFVGLANGTKEWTDPKTNEKVKRPYYNGLSFHRIIAGFMIQGGDPLGTGTGGPGFSIPDEFQSGRKLEKAGILAMANKGTPGSGGAQFFITLAPTPWLNGKHTVFGEVIEGMDVIEKMGAVKTSKPGDKPLTPVVIKTVKIEHK